MGRQIVNIKEKREITTKQEQSLIEKIRGLTHKKIAEVEDFVDFLRQRNIDRRLTQAAAKLSEKAFQKVWDNPDDADYDKL